MSIEVLQEVLHQGLEARRKQDARLASEQRRSAVLAGAFIPVAAFVTALLASPAVDASSQQVLTAGAIALLIALANGACWFLAHSVPVKWHEGPDTIELVSDFATRYDGYRALLIHLIDLHDDHRRRNEKLLDRVRFWFGVQATFTFVAICVLIGAVRAIG